MFGTRVLLQAAVPCAAVFLVAGLYDTSLFPASCVVGAVLMICARLIVFMSRSGIFVIRTLIGQWGSVVDAGHGMERVKCRLEEIMRSRCSVLTVLVVQTGVVSCPSAALPGRRVV